MGRAALPLGGCTTFESPTHENNSTMDSTMVTATGRAADVSAGANTSHNCPDCAPTTSSATQTQVDMAGERIAHSAINSFPFRDRASDNRRYRRLTCLAPTLMTPLGPTAVRSLLVVDIFLGTKISTIDCVALALPSTPRFFQ